MTMSFNFGRFSAGRPVPRRVPSERFRIAVLGDFSGRAQHRTPRGSDELARCKPVKLDVDTLDRVLAGFGTRLHLSLDGAAETIELNPRSLDDLHPDALVDRLPLFGALAGLRQRLAQPSTFAAAAAEVRQWTWTPPAEAPAPAAPRGDALRIDAKLSDFARLVGATGMPPAAPPPSGPLDALLRRAVAPHVVQALDADAPMLTAAVDRALSETMRRLLHHPDFQRLEAAWRALDFLARRIETDPEALQVVLYDISADEFAADLSATDKLEDTGLYKLLVEQPALDAHQGPLSLLVGHYGFEMTPPHAELLGRIAGIAAQARAPFVAALGRDCIGIDRQALHPLVADAWNALCALPAARFVALLSPRFLLRAPYGAKSEPIDRFAFEEFDVQAGMAGLLWGNPALLAAVLLAQQAQQNGPAEEPGALPTLDDMPYFFHTDSDGETVALPCTERLLSERDAVQLQDLGAVPVYAHRGRPEVRLGSLLALAGSALAGPWTPAGELADLAGAPAAAGTPRDEAELDALLAQWARVGVPPAGIDPDLAALLGRQKG